MEVIPNVSEMLEALEQDVKHHNLILENTDSKEIIPHSEEVLESPSDHTFDPCESDPEEIAPLSQTSTSDSRFTAYGQVVINQAKADGRLVEFASKMPPPKKRGKMLKPDTRVNNTDTWSKYVFREANGINDWQLGSEWARFSEEMTSFRGAGTTKKKQSKVGPSEDLSQDVLLQSNCSSSLQTKLKKYESLFYKTKPLSNNDFEEGMEILKWLKLNQHIDENTYNLGIKELGG